MALPAHSLIVQTDVAVGFHTAGGHQTALGIDDNCTIRRNQIRTHSPDPSIVINEHTAAGYIGPGHGFNIAIFDEKYGNKRLLYESKRISP
jgi:hypothetical protein